MDVMAFALILVLIAVNALYVAAEFAAVSVRHGQIRQLAQDGSAIAQRLLPIVDDTSKLDSYIATCQIGITLSSLVLGAYGQATVGVDLAFVLRTSAGMSAAAALSTAAIVVLITLTILQVVFGELVPKSLALQHSTRVALWTYYPMRWSQLLLRPFIAILNGSGNLLLRAFGGLGHGSHRHIHSPEEIEMLIVESSDGGLLEPEEQERLRQALHIGHRTVRELMVPRRLVECIDADTPLSEALDAAIASPYSRLPVYRDTHDNVIGLLHTKDLVGYMTSDGTPERERSNNLESLLRPIATVPSSVTGDELIALFRSQRSRFALAIDEHGGVDGIVTLEDVLDELVGAVADEFKGHHRSAEWLDDGRIRVTGMTRLDELSQWIGTGFEAQSSATIAGLILELLGHVPVPGESVTHERFMFTVEAMDGHAIASILITGHGGTMADTPSAR